jgi:site-specific recombinase XerD
MLGLVCLTAPLSCVQRECMRIDDDIRWLVALVSDTGMRLAEAAGLSMDDITSKLSFLSWKCVLTRSAA